MTRFEKVINVCSYGMNLEVIEAFLDYVRSQNHGHMAYAYEKSPNIQLFELRLLVDQVSNSTPVLYETVLT